MCVCVCVCVCASLIYPVLMLGAALMCSCSLSSCFVCVRSYFHMNMQRACYFIRAVGRDVIVPEGELRAGAPAQRGSRSHTHLNMPSISVMEPLCFPLHSPRPSISTYTHTCIQCLGFKGSLFFRAPSVTNKDVLLAD